ncbi:hypothetical protein Axi01nite_49990 [Actinoplanes xinjiangensis]|nr:hypothetical protein Axi01nite_49990 [Actinoplanes xinjiangensis]
MPDRRDPAERGRVLSPAVCGAEPAGERLGLYFPSPGMRWDQETDGPYPESPPVPDPFAEWNAPDICRPWLLTWLLEPEPAVAPSRSRSNRPHGGHV